MINSFTKGILISFLHQISHRLEAWNSGGRDQYTQYFQFCHLQEVLKVLESWMNHFPEGREVSDTRPNVTRIFHFRQRLSNMSSVLVVPYWPAVHSWTDVEGKWCMVSETFVVDGLLSQGRPDCSLDRPDQLAPYPQKTQLIRPPMFQFLVWGL